MAGDLTLRLELVLDGGDAHLEAQLTVTNAGGATVQVLSWQITF